MSKENPRYPLLELEVLTIIKSHIGSEHAISREDLLRDLINRGYNLDDRKMRKVIENLRFNEKLGALICNTQSGQGYFMASSLEEFKAFELHEKSRWESQAMRLSRQSKRAKKILSKQAEMESPMNMRIGG